MNLNLDTSNHLFEGLLHIDSSYFRPGGAGAWTWGASIWRWTLPGSAWLQGRVRLDICRSAKVLVVMNTITPYVSFVRTAIGQEETFV